MPRIYAGYGVLQTPRKVRSERKIEKRILELDEKMINRVKRTYNNMDPDIMMDMPYISTTDGRWLKSMLKASYF